MNMGTTDYSGGSSIPVTNKSKKARSAEEKAAAKAIKSQQDDLDSLQITFYEIESWIEKTAPVLARMTNELNKASFRFEKQRQDKVQKQQQIQPQPSQSLPPQRQLSQQQQQQQQQMHIQPQPSQSLQPITTSHQHQQYQQHNSNNNSNYNYNHKPHIVLDQNNPISSPSQTNIQSPTEENKDPMQWTLSFQPGNSLRLETNITSVEQLVEAVQKIRLLGDPNNNSNNNHNSNNTHAFSLTSASSLSIPWIGSDQLRLGSTTEYWRVALERRPRSILEDYKIDELNLSQLTENVSPHILNYACRVYWDCLHPKFSADWTSFWDRSGDPKRNQVCINSGLAMVFLHIMRHHKDSCPRANEIGYYYYERAREALMDYFDSPDCATLETMMNLAMFCIFYKRHSQARIHIGLSYRMILDMGIHQQSNWPKEDLHLRKKYLKLFMVLYYNDMCVSMYSGEPTQLNDHDIDVDFYELLNVNQNIQPPPDDKSIVKDTFFVHLLSLAKIGKRTLLLMEDYQRQHPDHHQQQHLDDLPLTWANQIQTLEVDLAKWFDKLPNDYRADPQPTALPSSSSSASSSTTSPSSREREHIAMNAATLKKQSALLLMLQYQTQWLLLHKTFANIDPSTLSTTMAAAYTSSSSSSILPQGADRSREICTDAANRIVVIGEIITEEYGWCVCQQFMSCIYQASTIYCRNALSKNESSKQHAKTMIKRIMEILRSSKINYSGLPDDMIMCLNEFLVKHGMEPPPPSSPPSEPSSSKDNCCDHDLIDSKNKDERMQQEQPSSSSSSSPLEGSQLLDQWVSFEKSTAATTTTTIDSSPSSSETISSVSSRLDSFNDTLYNSPHKYLECLHQQSIHRPPLSTQYHQTDAMLSIKIQDPIVENTMSMDYELEHRKNWRTMFSSSNITQVHQRML